MIATHRIFGTGLLSAAIGSAALGQARGPEWIEEGDAGSMPNGAQNTIGEGSMLGIRGDLSEGLRGVDFIDMYWIRIIDPSRFSASTTFDNEGFAQFNSALWLFTPEFLRSRGENDILGFGLLANDTEPGNEFGHSTLKQFSTDNSGASVQKRGLYLLAISFSFAKPVSDSGDIYFFENPFEISGPDGPGGMNPMTHWEVPRGSGGGEYRIALRGVGFGNLPAPGAVAILALSGLVLRSRRRRC